MEHLEKAFSKKSVSQLLGELEKELQGDRTPVVARHLDELRKELKARMRAQYVPHWADYSTVLTELFEEEDFAESDLRDVRNPRPVAGGRRGGSTGYPTGARRT